MYMSYALKRPPKNIVRKKILLIMHFCNSHDAVGMKQSPSCLDGSWSFTGGLPPGGLEEKNPRLVLLAPLVLSLLQCSMLVPDMRLAAVH